ncbi:ImmA/IrrE family metallo-endopeptidase [[Pseudomonas] boreopolis]|uniref:ImmA/IrrE family metallo-endopeptidase n=1 Tax=Xanthomonas boreopolis TaxID=86183 RepID=UPI003D9AEE34
MESGADFKRRLIQQAGLTSSIVDAAWPEWWSEQAEASDSAKTELRFSIARKLGLDPRTLLDDRVPRWIWEDAARFKSFRGDVQGHQPAISSFGMALGRILLGAIDPIEFEFPDHLGAADLRAMLLRSRPVVGLLELLQLAWGLGIPVIHLRTYPLSAKQMSAMSVCINERFVIFLAKDSRYPAPSAFHLAHELGHIFLRHLAPGQSIVDLGGLGDPEDEAADDEEQQADAFAMELLTGVPDLRLQIEGKGRAARKLAEQARLIEETHRIDAGVVALSYGFQTTNWPTAMASLAHIYGRPYPVWKVVNRIAERSIRWSALEGESESYVRAVMGGGNG